jgi:hypothetical protein
MKCDTVIKYLSWFLDDVLDEDKAGRVSLHLNQCDRCRREFDRLVLLRRKLASMQRPESPDYLRHLVELRLTRAARETWRGTLRNAWEYRLSKIRTTEAIWYLTRLLGTATTFLLFFAISASINPLYLGFHQQQAAERAEVSQALRELLLKNLGLPPVEAQKKRSAAVEPALNDLYFLSFGENASRVANDDTFSVVTVVDRKGTAKIQNVLEYPADSSLLSDFNSMITSARCRPALQNGRAVDSHLVMSFSKISVYD